MSKGELERIQQTHRVVSSKLVAGRPLVHVYCDQDPGEGFTQVEPDLEDLFFSTLQGVA
jgi:hypothetical protein